MTDFDPDVVYHVTYDGWPIQRQVSKDGQTNPIGFNDLRAAQRVRDWLRSELVQEYMNDTEHTQVAASHIADQRILLARQDI